VKPSLKNKNVISSLESKRILKEVS
jgi:hypothetical protein